MASIRFSTNELLSISNGIRRALQSPMAMRQANLTAADINEISLAIVAGADSFEVDPTLLAKAGEAYSIGLLNDYASKGRPQSHPAYSFELAYSLLQKIDAGIAHLSKKGKSSDYQKQCLSLFDRNFGPQAPTRERRKSAVSKSAPPQTAGDYDQLACEMLLIKFGVSDSMRFHYDHEKMALVVQDAATPKIIELKFASKADEALFVTIAIIKAIIGRNTACVTANRQNFCDYYASSLNFLEIVDWVGVFAKAAKLVEFKNDEIVLDAFEVFTKDTPVADEVNQDILQARDLLTQLDRQYLTSPKVTGISERTLQIATGISVMPYLDLSAKKNEEAGNATSDLSQTVETWRKSSAALKESIRDVAVAAQTFVEKATQWVQAEASDAAEQVHITQNIRALRTNPDARKTFGISRTDLTIASKKNKRARLASFEGRIPPKLTRHQLHVMSVLKGPQVAGRLTSLKKNR